MRYFFLPLFFSWVLGSTNLLAQNDLQKKAQELEEKGSVCLGRNENDSARIFYLESAAIYKSIDAYENYANEVSYACYVYLTQEEHETIINLVNQVLEELRPHYPNYQNSSITTLLNYKALAYYRQADWVNADQVYQQILSIHHSMNIPIPPNILSDLSFVSTSRGDYQAAASYMKQYRNCFPSTDYSKEYDIQAHLALIYISYNKPNLALTACEKAEAALPLLTGYSPKAQAALRAVILDKRARVYSIQKKHNKAISTIKEALNITNDQRATYQSNLGLFYLNKGDFDNAYHYLQLGLENYLQREREKKDVNPVDIGATYTLLARYYNYKQQYTAAAQHAQYALNYLLVNFQEKELMINPKLTQISYGHRVRKVLHYKAKALIGKGMTEDDADSYKLGLDTYDLVIKLLAKMRTSYDAQGSKVALAGDTWQVFEDAIKGCLALYAKTQKEEYLELAWKYSEYSKSELLQDAFAEAKANNNLGVSEDILEREQQLKIEIELLNGEIRTLKHISNNKADSLKNRQFKLESELNELKKQIAVMYPNYHQLQYDRTLPNVQDVQNQLEKNEAIIQYFLGEKMIYIFVFDQEKLQAHQLTYPPSLTNLVRQMREGLTPQHVEENPEQSHQYYTKSAYKLYQLMVLPIIEQLSPNIDQLIIIPDGELSYIPFELLLTEIVDTDNLNYKGMPYFIRNYQINYAYLSSFKNTTSKLYGAPNQSGVLAFAPSYTNDILTDNTTTLPSKYRDQLGDLIWNTKEVETIDQFLPMQQYLKSEATEQRFKEQAPQYQILHLAMHALVNEEEAMQSKLVFSLTPDGQEDGFLNLYELYAMKLRADLVVLSACNTGYGQYIRGEGVASLGRAFAYAGCPNVVMSHWSVDDKSTAQLMEYFYQNLSEGLSKGQALQQAKLTYIEKAAPRDAHPAFWGAFILIGEDSTLSENTAMTSWLIGLLLMGLVILLGIVIKRKTKK